MPAYPPAPGLHLPPVGTDGPARAAVFAGHATGVQVCLLSDDGGAVVSTHQLRRAEAGMWTGQVPAVEGTRYLLQVDGPWDPAAGHRHNPAKLALDPYAPLVAGDVDWGSEVFGHQVTDQLAPLHDDHGVLMADPRSNLGRVPVGVVTRVPVADQARRPRVPREDTVVYEAHLKGLTMLHPAVPQELRGTWAGLAHPAMVEYLTDLGVTAVELLPVFAMADETHLVARGLTNHWGYNTLNFFSPSLRYISRAAQAAGPEAILAEVHDAVQTLHGAGLEVWLDVVYNHTCEGGHDGPSFSFRGVDEAAYYRKGADGRDFDVTGCGNTLDFAHPRVVALALDSLRHWTTAFGIDGYRFDLAPALARRGSAQGHAFDPDHPFLVAARADPMLQDVKLVAEPWDLGPDGWRTGHFPPPFSEWNDRFRDTVRRFWVTDAASARHGGPVSDLRELATCLAGSSDLFGVSHSYDATARSPQASVNLVTAHDGFTLADLLRYNERHNQANGEENRDGSDHNLSWNHGVEGESDDPDAVTARNGTARALLGTLLLSAGMPMLLAGDELGRTQHGNNNPYCQDNAISWTDWELTDRDLHGHVRELLRLRASHPILRQPTRNDDIAWLSSSGTPMDHDAWHNPAVRTLQMRLDGSLLVVLNGSGECVTCTLPGDIHEPPYELRWDSSLQRVADLVPVRSEPGTQHTVPARSIRVFSQG